MGNTIVVEIPAPLIRASPSVATTGHTSPTGPVPIVVGDSLMMYGVLPLDVTDNRVSLLALISASLQHLNDPSHQLGDERLALEILESISPRLLPLTTFLNRDALPNVTSTVCPICFQDAILGNREEMLLQRVVFKQGEEIRPTIVGLIAAYLGGYARQLPCSHVFHQICIDDWLLPRFGSDAVDFDCPICRQIVN